MLPATRIMVVDDDPTSHEVFHEYLPDEFEVVPAMSAHEAIDKAARFQPQVVLLDVVLPRMDGFELCPRLRQIAGMRDAVIIIVSAKAMASDKARGLAAGANAYVSKPFDYPRLFDLVRGLVKNNGFCECPGGAGRAALPAKSQ